MTQNEFNARVLTLKNRLIDLTVTTSDMNRIKDPYSEQSKHRQRFLANIVSALDGYDLSTELLTEDQILYTFELGICSGQSCSI